MRIPPNPDQDHPKLLAFTNGRRDEIWKRGRTLVVVPAILEDYPAQLKEAINRRRAVLIHGECPCGATLPAAAIDICSQGEDIVVLHEAGCIGRDAEQLLAEWVKNRSQS